MASPECSHVYFRPFQKAAAEQEDLPSHLLQGSSSRKPVPMCSKWTMVIVYPAYKNKIYIKNFGFALYNFS